MGNSLRMTMMTQILVEFMESFSSMLEVFKVLVILYQTEIVLREHGLIYHEVIIHLAGFNAKSRLSGSNKGHSSRNVIHF